ncbi:ead/Ea22-like family protein [Enterobacter ludwigii]|uniref:ead/Ea22-like family protein n=1 Tax=Enterobacter ludwigii TaxID=299767 RepID=UPI0006436AAD|nr:ead/Ea22-like family protein [Enterobacter ludwigii]KLP36190.1 hypothetical protein ABR36_16620 [Enterobacter ludwigii]
MSNIDKQALRNLALRATQGPWTMEHENIWYCENGYTKHLAYFCQGDDVDDHQDDANTRYVAAADPTTVLALLDELVASQKSNEFLKEQLTQLANFNPDWDKLEATTDSLREHIAKLSAAEKRIAELQASHNNLREAMAGIHNTIAGGGAYTPLAAILNASKRAYEESAAAAGKGE